MRPGPHETAAGSEVSWPPRTPTRTSCRRRITCARGRCPCRGRRGQGGRAPNVRASAARALRHLLGELLVLPGQVRVRLQQLRKLVRLCLDGFDPALRLLLLAAVEAFDHHVMCLVAFGLTRLREKDERCGVRRLQREPEIQENEWVFIPAESQRSRVERDPGDDDDRLADDVLRRAEEACRLLRRTAEGVLAEGAVVLGDGHAPTVEPAADSSRKLRLIRDDRVAAASAGRSCTSRRFNWMRRYVRAKRSTPRSRGRSRSIRTAIATSRRSSNKSSSRQRRSATPRAWAKRSSSGSANRSSRASLRHLVRGLRPVNAVEVAYLPRLRRAVDLVALNAALGELDGERSHVELLPGLVRRRDRERERVDPGALLGQALEFGGVSPLLRGDLQRLGNLAGGPRGDVASGDLDRQFADLDGRVVRRRRRLAGQQLTDRPVAGRLLKREDGVVRATTGASRRVFETMARRKLAIAGHVRPTVPQSPPTNGSACRGDSADAVGGACSA